MLLVVGMVVLAVLVSTPLLRKLVEWYIGPQPVMPTDETDEILVNPHWWDDDLDIMSSAVAVIEQQKALVLKAAGRRMAKIMCACVAVMAGVATLIAAAAVYL